VFVVKHLDRELALSVPKNPDGRGWRLEFKNRKLLQHLPRSTYIVWAVNRNFTNLCLKI